MARSSDDGAGWYHDPSLPGTARAQRYWDGQRWTYRTRIRVPAVRRVTMAALVLLSVAVVVLGAPVAFDQPADTGPYSEYCHRSPVQLVSAGAWAAWLLLVLLAMAALLLWVATDALDVGLAIPSLLILSAVLVLCPCWLVAMAMANCSL